MSDVLIVGCQGLIGRALADTCEREGIRWVGTARSPQSKKVYALDLASSPEKWSLPELGKVAILCAAETKVSHCETNPESTHRINVTQTVALAQWLWKQGVSVVFLSTNLVYDGSKPDFTPSAKTVPQTQYGAQKAECEKLLQAAIPALAIVRLTKVVHEGFAVFCDWIQSLRGGEVIHPFHDMQFSPIPLSGVLDELKQLIVGFRAGVFQLSGDRDVSYSEAAFLLAETLGFDVALVQPVSARERGISVSQCPTYTTLSPYRVNGATVPWMTGDTLPTLFRAMAAK